MMTWNELAERIASMPPEQLRDSVPFESIRRVATAVSLGFWAEEAPEEFMIATGIRCDPAELEDIGDGDRMEWYPRRS
jgi:hypothetical protein